VSNESIRKGFSKEDAMRRLFAGFVLTVLAVGATTAPALAKGPGDPGGGEPEISVAITGPGLSGAIVLHQEEAWKMVYLTTHRSYGASTESKPSGALGPRYVARYTLEREGHATLWFHQFLYPYAKGLPWAFTPQGQRFDSPDGDNSAPVNGGWWHSVLIRQVLTSHGLPARAPAVARSTAAKTAGFSFPVGWMGFALGALTLLLTAEAVVRRRRAGRPE
jgi:hypothetical protein